VRVLVGCECSGIVRDAFRRRGHDAWSCDLKPSERPGPHLQCDVLTVLHMGWDIAIFHPDCTFLTCSAEWAYGDGPYHQKVKPGTLVGAARRVARVQATAFAKPLIVSLEICWSTRIRGRELNRWIHQRSTGSYPDRGGQIPFVSRVEF
jgi:hypothetical protein